MRESIYIKEEELLKKAISILTDKLGPVETSRFLSMQRAKRTESVKRHRDWQSKLDKEEFFISVFKGNKG